MQTKTGTQNKSVWGALAMLIAFTLQQFNVAAEASEIETVIGQVVEAAQILAGVGGFLLVLWDRIRTRDKK